MHKLSKRLALGEALPLLVAATAFVACEPTPLDPKIALLLVANVITSPSTVTLDPNGTRQFQAFGRTQAGDSVAVPVHWSASDGSITSGGLYTAGPTSGDFLVTATATTNTAVKGSSRVTNRGPVTRVVVTPVSASVLT